MSTLSTFRLALAALLLVGCAHPPVPGTRLERRGDEISVCGQLFHTGARVVLWNDPGGYDAYRIEPRFSGAVEAATGGELRPRFGSNRRNLPSDVAERVARTGWSVGDLQKVVRMFVLHYDAAGNSRQCFKILHDVRGLSSHFLLDVDGTIYQTLDLKERAWHASEANDASIGIEIAHVGAFENPDDTTLKNWYDADLEGMRVRFPAWMRETGIATPGFVARPARTDMVRGEIHGTTYHQYDFTDAQYEALIRLSAALVKIFPRMALEVPREGESVRSTALTPGELETFGGILGHWHVTTRKVDPGPAFDWNRLLEGARAHL